LYNILKIFAIVLALGTYVTLKDLGKSFKCKQYETSQDISSTLSVLL